MANKKGKEKGEKVEIKKDSKMFAFLATFLSIIGFVIAIIAKRDDRYVMHYAKQSLIVFIAIIIGEAITFVLLWIPIIGEIINILVWVILTILWVYSWVYALSKEIKFVPFIGKYANKISL